MVRDIPPSGRMRGLSRRQDITDDNKNASKMRGSRSRSRSRPFTRARSKSRSRFEVREPEPERPDEEEVNKFVQYKKFGMYATEISRVIAIDEVPEITEGRQVVVKVKVRACSHVACICLTQLNMLSHLILKQCDRLLQCH